MSIFDNVCPVGGPPAGSYSQGAFFYNSSGQFPEYVVDSAEQLFVRFGFLRVTAATSPTNGVGLLPGPGVDWMVVPLWFAPLTEEYYPTYDADVVVPPTSGGGGGGTGNPHVPGQAPTLRYLDYFNVPETGYGL